MSKKVTKVDGSIDEKNGLKCTVGDKSLGLLSTSIDKALGGKLKDKETQLKCSPEKAESENVVAEGVSAQQASTKKQWLRRPQRRR